MSKIKQKVGYVSLSLNSKAYESWKKSVIGRPHWTGNGLIVEVDVIGKRQVSWERKKGRAQKCRWVPRVNKNLCLGKLGVGPNKLAAQIPVNVSCLGPNVISPITIESGEGSVSCVEPLSSADIHEKARESPRASPMGFEVPT